MKIKEVIALTGLTDRAIRLYIEHGLLFPDTNTVRYGLSYRLDANVNPTPYYETVDWE